MAAMIAVDAIRATDRTQPTIYGVALSTWLWIAGGVLSVWLWVGGGLASFALTTVDADCGSAASSPCLDHPGSVLSVISAVSFVLPTVILIVVCWRGWRSYSCSLVAPPLIASLYLLTVHLELPHMGFGDVTSCRLPYLPDCYHLDEQGRAVSDAANGVVDLSVLALPLLMLGLAALVVTCGVAVYRSGQRRTRP